MRWKGTARAACPSAPCCRGPNGRRVTDDVVAIELRALAGVTYPLIEAAFKPDAAAGQLTDGLTPASVHAPYLGHFPYLGVPYSGYDEPH